ncbi:aminotransferase class I/II-fold pyridoxal phosphate-dependent enzyme [Corallococcus sp. ZKHCc1 1396]|uniref:Aminotransferase class I/II-fold pyridoxal phosphate-dependent enzyme n=1 Tax=Corallococcus soli TaxID=2710757 RepID=A0ABR9PV98_9BACT|nr:aminotransferase class I/II-fold pyridoxal phosphate-dependent enzyme [Corallococcus soli]MBE4751862.1 aminotransferase class I/II-fold pyridoxal phosphate-dependent enzyme [Corallococcus soli]
MKSTPEWNVEPAEGAPPQLPEQQLSMRDRLRLTESAESHLKELLSAETKLPLVSIEAQKPLQKYGIDSILISNLTRKLEGTFGPLPKTLFFEHKTLSSVAEYFVDHHRPQLVRAVGFSPEDALFLSASASQAAVAGPTPEAPPAPSRPQAPDAAGRGQASRFWRRDGAKAPRAPEPRASEPPIAIIGLAGRYPDADDVAQFWDNLKSGRDSIREIPADRWDVEKYFEPVKNRLGRTYSKWGGFVRDHDRFDHRFFSMSKADADFTDPQERVWLECVWHALEDAGYTPQGLHGKRVGVFVGVMSNMYQKLDVVVDGYAIAPVASAASIANRVSYQMDFTGPSLTLDTMCSSSLTAIHLASESLKRGECDVAIAGGVNLIVHPNKYVMLSLNGFLSTDGRCRSFGEGGDGYVPGEGAGAVVLKAATAAEADGDHVYGLIRGSSINHGGRVNGYTVPSPTAQASLIEDAFTRAGVNPRRLSYVEAHGTGTSLGDPVEVRALSIAMEKQTTERQFCAIGSVKSNIGHLESAAGIAGLTKVLLQMHHEQLVPSLHSDKLNPNIDFRNSPVYVQRALTDWAPASSATGEAQPRMAAVSGFGAGGSNAHVIIEEAPAPRSRAAEDATGARVVLLSAATLEQLRDYARRFIAFLEAPGASRPTLAEVAFTTQVGRVALDERIAFVVSSTGQLLERLRAFAAGAASQPDTYRGTVKEGGSGGVAASLVSGPEGAEIVRILMAGGNFTKLCQLWAMGLDVEWAGLYGAQHPRRVSLPGYPFARTHCWVPESSQAAAPVARASAAPPAITPVAAAPVAATDADPLHELILNAVSVVNPVARADMTVDQLLFEELHFDSIMLAQLNTRLMQSFPDLALSPELYSPEITIRKLADKLRELQGGPVTAAAPALESSTTPAPATASASVAGEVPDRVETFPEVAAIRRWNGVLEQAGMAPLLPLEGPNGVVIQQGEASLLNFSTYDFLGLASDRRVKDAAIQAAGHFGTSASASRPVSGEMPLYREFEQKLATFMGTEHAVLFVSGHATNVTTLEILIGQGDLLLVDEASRDRNLAEGGFVSGAEVMVFPHNDPAALDALLTQVRNRYRKVVIAVEGIYTRDGDIPDLPRFVELKKKHHAFLLVDEDNSFGVLGATGRGVCEHFGIAPGEVDIHSGGINKSLASCGGFVAGDRALVDYIKHHATSLIFAVSISPMSTASAIKALDVLEAEPERAKRARDTASLLRGELVSRGWKAGGSEGSPYVVVTVPDTTASLALAHALRQKGVVADWRGANDLGEDRAQIIFCATAEHTEDHVLRVLEALEGELPRLTAGDARLAALVTPAEAEWRKAFGPSLDHRIARDAAGLRSQAPVFEGEVPTELYRVAEFPEYKNMTKRLTTVAPDQFLYFKPHEGRVSDTICVGGRRMINYSSFNYLGLSGNDEVVAGAQTSVERYGTSSSASRRGSGTLQVHRELEKELADFIGVEEAIVFDAGHNTNVSTVGHLFGKGDLVLHDSLSHNSLIQGALLSGADRQPFPHNDYDAVDAILTNLRGRYRRVGVIIEGIYSQDGDIPDLKKFIEVKKRHQAILFIDEAHSIGVIGPSGRGVAEQFGVDPADCDILMGTISKSLATSGGYVAGSRALIDLLRETPCYRNNVNLSAAVAGAALEAVRVLRRNPEKVATLHARANLFLTLAKAHQLNTGLSNGSGIVPLMTYSSALAYRMTYALLEMGVTVHPFTYPVVPEGQARLRFFITADHTEEQIRFTVKEMARVARDFHAEQAAAGKPRLSNTGS